MLVKAKWNVKDAAGWHSAGEVFETNTDLGDSVEVIGGQAKPVEKADEKPASVKKPEPAKAEPAKEEPAKEEPVVKTAPSRRKKVSK